MTYPLTYQQIVSTFASLYQQGLTGYSYYVAPNILQTYINGGEGGASYSGYSVIGDNQVNLISINFTNISGLNTLHYNNTLGRLNLLPQDAINLQSGSIINYTPNTSNDPSGVAGQITYDSEFLYIRGLTAWGRTLLNNF